MRRLVKLIVAGLLATLSAAPVAAQDVSVMRKMDAAKGGHSSFPKTPSALRKVASYGGCVGAFAVSTPLLANLPGSAKDLRLVSGLARFSGCGNETPSFPRSAMRGMFAEYLYEFDFNASGTAKLKHKPAGIYLDQTNEQLAKLDPEVRRAVVLNDVGQCVATANPSGVAELLSADVATSDEAAAFQALVSAIAGCVPRGLDLRMHKMFLRGFLAEGAYRAAVARNGGLK